MRRVDAQAKAISLLTREETSPSERNVERAKVWALLALSLPVSEEPVTVEPPVYERGY